MRDGCKETRYETSRHGTAHKRVSCVKITEPALRSGSTSTGTYMDRAVLPLEGYELIREWAEPYLHGRRPVNAMRPNPVLHAEHVRRWELWRQKFEDTFAGLSYYKGGALLPCQWTLVHKFPEGQSPGSDDLKDVADFNQYILTAHPAAEGYMCAVGEFPKFQVEPHTALVDFSSGQFANRKLHPAWNTA